MTKVVGIDLGTTKSAVAVWQDGEPRIIHNDVGDPIIPSVIALDPASGELVVGRRAKLLAVKHPSEAIYSVKRFLGRRFSDEVVQTALKKLRILYGVEEYHRVKDGISVAIGDRHMTPQEASAKILQHIKTYAETFLGHEITEAVVTVPAYFHDSQRQATREAGRIAGLDVKRVLNEPTAACLAFGYRKLLEKRKTVAVYDLGGGTFDISILEVGQGPFRVRSTNGNTYLGGDDIDWAIVDWAINMVSKEGAVLLRTDVQAITRLRAAAEMVKKDLSVEEVAQLKVEGPLSPDSKVSDLSLELTRKKLEELTEPLVKQTLVSCEQALHDARLRASDIKEVLLVGGQTRMPAVRQAVRDFFGMEPNTSVEPEEVVALGAAVQAAILTGEVTGLKLADVVPLSLGVSTKGLIDIIIPRNTPTPVTKTKIYSTAYDNQESVEIKIYQGEGKTAEENNKLGEFILKGIIPAPAEVPEIEVTFRVDPDGILQVTGKDLRTDNSHEMTITDSMRLSVD